MKPLPVLCLLLLPALGVAQEAPPPPSPPVASSDVDPAAVQEEKIVSYNGQSFVLANSTKGTNVETEEYVLRGEKLADWSQLLTMQRLSLAKPTSPDEFVAFFQRKTNQEGGARLEILQQGKSASVFAVHFAKGDQNDEQVMVCLVMGEKSGALNLVQYAVKPSRLAADVVALQLKSWKAKLGQQALASK